MNRVIDYFKNLIPKKDIPSKKTEVVFLGQWKIIFNAPYGFVVRNRLARENYHFYAESNGWITGEWAVGRPDTEAVCTAFNSMGAVLSMPVMVDEKSTRNQERINELREKDSLNENEKEELLILAGIRKK